MRGRYFYLCVVVLLASCLGKEQQIATETVSFDVVTDSVFSIMPGSLLVFASYSFPFIAIYNLESNMPVPVFRTTIKSDLYSKTGDAIKVDARRTGNMSMTLSKDYIITIQRDYEYDNTDELTVGMDFNKLPKTLFLYDYSGDLKRIVDVGIPIFRVGGNEKDNTVYAIGVNPDFMIVRIEL